jgi:hypothetical protein
MLINNPIPFNSSLVTRGSCASVSNFSGNLLFYTNTRSGIGNPSGLVWNSNHELMVNGDSITGSGWYNEMLIVNFPENDSLHYLVSIGVTFPEGIVYSIIDMHQDGGLGSVVQKNIPLLGGLMVDCVTAIKHGNGRDWWIMVRPSPVGRAVWLIRHLLELEIEDIYDEEHRYAQIENDIDGSSYFSNSNLKFANPASKVLRSVSEIELLNANIELYNSFGQMVLKVFVNHSNKEIDISHLTNGLYMYKLKTARGKQYSGKVIIANDF